MARNAKNTRMCAGCRTHNVCSELIRIYKTADGTVSVSFSGEKCGGRGLYICKSEKCLEMIVKRKSISRSMKCELPSEVYESIEEFVKLKDVE